MSGDLEAAIAAGATHVRVGSRGPRSEALDQVTSTSTRGTPSGVPRVAEDHSHERRMRKIGEYLGLLEDTGRYDDEFDDAGYDSDASATPRPRPSAGSPSARKPSAVRASVARPRSPTWPSAGRARPTAVVAELSRITTLHPRTYNEARTVGENFRDGTPVIMNLSDMDDNDAKRLVDFAAGLVFATRGTIERITNKVFLLSPPNVTVAAEDKQRIAEGGFFNQS